MQHLSTLPSLNPTIYFSCLAFLKILSPLNSSLAWKPDKRSPGMMISVISKKKNLPAVDLNVNCLPSMSSVEQHLSNFGDLVQSFIYHWFLCLLALLIAFNTLRPQYQNMWIFLWLRLSSCSSIKFWFLYLEAWLLRWIDVWDCYVHLIHWLLYHYEMTFFVPDDILCSKISFVQY